MKNLLLLMMLPVFLMLGCQDPELSASPQAELENVARCFRAATTILQSEPDSPPEFADFLRRAKDKAQLLDSVSVDADFDALRWDSEGTKLLTSSGETIQCRIAGQEHDNYGPSGTTWFTEYEFSVPNTEFRSQTTIELSMMNDSP